MLDTNMPIVEEMQGAFRRNMAARVDGYRVVRDHMGSLGERNAHFAQSFYEDAISAVERQYEGNRALAGELVEQSSRQREALQTIASQSMSAWMGFFDRSFDDYRHGLELVEESVEKVVEDTVKVTGKMTEVAQDVVSESSTFPIEGYDNMNVEQVKKQLDRLNAAEIRAVSEYEKQHKNRETLIEQFDRKLKAQSA